MTGLIDTIVDRPRTVLAVVALCSLAAILSAARLQTDESLDGMLVGRHPERAYYDGFLERYGADDTVVIAVHGPSPLGLRNLERAQRLTRDLAAIRLTENEEASAPPAIDRVVSLANVDWIHSRRGPDGFSELAIDPLLRELPRDARQERILWQRAVHDPLFSGHILAAATSDDPSAELTTLVIARVPRRPGDLTYRRIMKTAVEHLVEVERARAEAGTEIYLAGTAILQPTLAVEAERNLNLLVPIALAVCFSILVAIFRRIAFAALALGVVLVALLWTLGFIAASGAQLNSGSAVILPLIVIVGFLTVIHGLFSFERASRTSANRAVIVRRMLLDIAMPTSLAVATTAIGLLALATSRISTLREVGLFAAFGVVSAWLLAHTLLPVSLLAVRPSSRDEYSRAARVALRHLLARLAAWVGRTPRLIVATFLVACTVASGAALRIDARTDLLGFLGPDHVLVTSYRLLGDEMGGVDPLEIVIRTPPSEAIEPAVLRRIDALQIWLEEQVEVGETLSVVDSIKRVHQEVHDGDPRFSRVPETRGQVADALLLLEATGDLEHYLHPGWEEASEMRVTARLRSLESSSVARFVERLRTRLRTDVVSDPVLVWPSAAVESHSRIRRLAEALLADLNWLAGREAERVVAEPLRAGQMSAHVTGLALLYAETARTIVESQVTSLVVATFFIWIVLLFLLRSIRLSLLAMVPNLMPLVMAYALMGSSGITLNVATVQFGVICLGVAVDDTIIFLTCYRRQRRRLEPRSAVEATLGEVAEPIVFTSACVALGLLVLCFSSFESHRDFGIIASFTMVVALLGDLVLLPACLLLAEGASLPPRATT